MPVWASAEAGSDGAMVLVNDPIEPKDFELPKAKWGKALMISEKRVG